MEQVAQTDCGVSTSEDVKNWTGQCPEQPALADPSAGQGGLDLQTALQTELFCEIYFVLQLVATF